MKQVQSLDSRTTFDPTIKIEFPENNMENHNSYSIFHISKKYWRLITCPSESVHKELIINLTDGVTTSKEIQTELYNG